MGIPPRIIHVYVADKSEYTEYKNDLNPSFYNGLHIGKRGLVQQREFIEQQWPKGQHIVFLDDDVASVDMSLSPRFKRTDLDAFIRQAFQECHKQGAYIWGIYPVFNPFFRDPKQEVTTYLSYIVGAFYGIVNRPKDKTLRLVVTRDDSAKEDVERSIKYFLKDGIVIRFNKIGFVTKYYGKSGGLGTFKDRITPMLESSKKLYAKYPDLGYLVTKKTGMSEFRLKRKI